MLQKATKEKQRALTKLRQQITDKKRENVDLDQKLRELQVCVLERKEIEDLAGVCLCVEVWHNSCVCVLWRCGLTLVSVCCGGVA